VELTPFDAARHMGSVEDQVALIADALETGDPACVATAVGVVARARGMSGVARDAGVTREALYKALRAEGDPRLSTLVKVLAALGIKLTATAA